MKVSVPSAAMPLLLALCASLHATPAIEIGKAVERIPRTEIIRDAAGAIVERITVARRPDGTFAVTVRDAAGRIIRIETWIPVK